MAGDDFRRLEHLFHEALTRPPEERDAFLAAACDEATASRVRELLEAEADPFFIKEPLARVIAPLVDDQVPIGTRIGDYEVVEHVGSGGMGHVYRARHVRLECDHAIKVLRAGQPKADERLLDEARHAAQLSHPNICKVYQVDRFEGRPYLVMEFVRGVTLEQRLAGGPLPFGAALRYATQMAGALAHAHAARVIHGDLKPANVLVDGYGDAKILDFGVARRLPQPITAQEPPPESGVASSSVRAGTLRYLAPEALQTGKADTRGDIWALGVILYEMITGASPFEGRSPSEIKSSILRRTPPAFDATVPPALEPIVRKCLEKEPERRYQTAGEVRAALEAATAAVSRRHTARPGVWRWLAVVLLLAAISVSAWLLLSRSGRSSDRVAVAVLPLESLSAEEDDYFADGLTEVLIGNIAQVRAIRVISRQSTLRYRGTSASPEEIARTLGVEYLVKGTVTRAGGRVRVTAQLLNPLTGENLWSTSTTRPVEDVLTLQNELAHEIARHVTVTIRPEEAERFSQGQPVPPAAVEAYLKGRALWNSRSRRGLEQAAQAFRAAIQIDRRQAQFHSGLADTYAVQGSLGLAPSRDVYPLAREAALEALRLDAGLAEPHAALGRVKFSFEWDGAGAEEAFRRAIAVNPGYATAHQWYSVFLATRRRLDDALREARLAEQSNPLSPIIHWNLARTYFFRGEHEPAMQSLDRALALDPGFAMAHLLAARIHVYQRRIPDARRALDLIPAEERTAEALALRSYIAAIAGDRKAALTQLARADADMEVKHALPYYAAWVHGALGRVDETFANLDRAADERSARIAFLNVDPELAPMRSDPRFRVLAERVRVIGPSSR